MITIRHRTGPLAGQEQCIDGRYDRITIGRDANVCDVVFPPDATVVARRHFALVRRPSGEWTFDLFGDPFVAVNGEPADVGQALHSGAVIELGRHGGPTFEVKLEGETLGGQLPVTDPQESVDSLHVAAGHAKKGSARARRIALAGVGVALVTALATVAIFRSSVRQDAQLENVIAAFHAAQASEASDRISPAVRETLVKAAYLVTIRYGDGQEEPYGTASPVARDLLATNAHVAALLRDEVGPADRMLVHAPGAGGRVYEVIEAKVHPGYAAFERFLTGPDPFFVGTSRLSGSVSFDVATLRVAPGGPDLSPILKVATPDELAELKPGFPLALAGYPTERIVGAEVQPLGATPTFAAGMVSAMTDEFHLPADFNHSRLVRHNIPVTGGASGSPIVGPSGRVVAYLNSGNVTPGPMNRGRVPSAALINYAQRADLLTDLLSGRAAETLDLERQYWAQQARTFKRGFDVIIPEILSGSTNPGDPVLINQERFSLTSANLIDKRDEKGNVRRDRDEYAIQEREQRHTVRLSGGMPYTFIAYALNSVFIELYLAVDGKIPKTCGPEHSDPCWNVEGAWFPSLSYTPASDATATLYVVGPAKSDTTYTFMHYRWGVTQR